MIAKLRLSYVFLVLSILYLDLIFPIYIPYVKLLILTNGLTLLTLMPKFRFPALGFLVYIVLLCLYVISLAFSSRIYDNVQRDVANIILLTSFVPIFYSTIRSQTDFENFQFSFYKTTLFVGVVVAAIGFYKFYRLTFTGSVPAYFVNEEQGDERFRLGTSLVGDYNYYALGLFFSLSVIPILYKRQENIFIRLFMVCGFLLLTVNIFLSGSRRGIVLILLLLFLLSVKHLKATLLKRKVLTRRLLIDRCINTVLLMGVILYSMSWVATNQTIFLESRELDKLFARIETVVDSESVTSERTIRWTKSVEIFGTYNIIEKLFGAGFDYLEIFGRLFSSSEDYPHNYLISSLLYGGVITFCGVGLFTVVTLMRYVRQRAVFKVMTLWFVLGIFMLLTSKNSMFSVQFLLFLFLLPYVRLNGGGLYKRKQT